MDDACAFEYEHFQSYLSSISPNYWGKTFGDNIDRFDSYVNVLSSHLSRCQSHFQFVSVGACDGSSDPMIRSFYDNKHWNAIFVEASPPNIQYLNEKISAKSALGRSYVLHAAAMEYCNEPTIEFARPLMQEKNASTTEAGTAKHWLRRQIGRVPKSTDAVKWFRKKSKAWALDRVPCMTAKQILENWEAHSPHPVRSPLNRLNWPYTHSLYYVLLTS